MHATRLSKSDIELLIEQKLLELLGDPDSGLDLKAAFIKKLKARLRSRETERVSHKKVMEKYGQS